MLTNVAYAGKVKYKNEIHAGEHEALVSDDVWKRVQAKLQRNGRTGGKMVRNKFGALLKGLLHCAPCGCAMTPTHATKERKKRYRYYLCTAAQKRGRQACPTPSIPAGEIERFLVEQIKGIGRDPQLVAETVRQAQLQATQRMDELDAEKRRLEREMAIRHRELQQLARHTGAVEPDSLATARFADLHERLACVERRLIEVRDEIESLQRELIEETDVVHALGQFDPVWEVLSPREQARLLQLLIERIDYDGRDGSVSITFHASGIKTLASRDSMGGAA